MFYWGETNGNAAASKFAEDQMIGKKLSVITNKTLHRNRELLVLYLGATSRIYESFPE